MLRPTRRRARRRRPAHCRRSISYCVSDEIVSCCASVIPAAFGSRRKNVGPIVGAREHEETIGRGRERHVAFGAGRVASRRRRRVARSCTPSGPNPRLGSSHAVVTITSPAEMAGATRRFCASDPASRMTPPLMTELTKWGDGASARPSSVYTTIASSIVIPLPPYSSGNVIPSKPSSASCSQNLSG